MSAMIVFDPSLDLATFANGNDFTQVVMSEGRARAIAEIVGVAFHINDSSHLRQWRTPETPRSMDLN